MACREIVIRSLMAPRPSGVLCCHVTHAWKFMTAGAHVKIFQFVACVMTSREQVILALFVPSCRKNC